MLEPALHHRFTQEPLDRLLRRGGRAHALHRHIARDLLVTRCHHLAHAALADAPAEAIPLTHDRIGSRLGTIFATTQLVAGDRDLDRRLVGFVSAHASTITESRSRTRVHNARLSGYSVSHVHSAC